MRGHGAKTVNRGKLRKMNCMENAAVDLLLPAALEDSPLLAVYPHENVMNEYIIQHYMKLQDLSRFETIKLRILLAKKSTLLSFPANIPTNYTKSVATSFMNRSGISI